MRRFGAMVRNGDGIECEVIHKFFLVLIIKP